MLDFVVSIYNRSFYDKLVKAYDSGCLFTSSNLAHIYILLSWYSTIHIYLSCYHDIVQFMNNQLVWRSIKYGNIVDAHHTLQVHNLSFVFVYLVLAVCSKLQHPTLCFYHFQDISVTLADKDGEQKHIEVPVGLSMLEVAHQNDIELEGKDFPSHPCCSY